jgi:hypothetical protein
MAMPQQSQTNWKEMLWNLKQQGLYGDAGSGLPYAHRFNPAWSQMGGPGPNGGNPMAGGDGGGGDQQRAGYQSPGGPFGLPGGAPNRFPLQGQPGQPNGGGQQRAWNPMQNPAMLNYLNRQTGDPNFLNIIDQMINRQEGQDQFNYQQQKIQEGLHQDDLYWEDLHEQPPGPGGLGRWAMPRQPDYWLLPR